MKIPSKMYPEFDKAIPIMREAASTLINMADKMENRTITMLDLLKSGSTMVQLGKAFDKLGGSL
jgi:hypothetical protein